MDSPVSPTPLDVAREALQLALVDLDAQRARVLAALDVLAPEVALERDVSSVTAPAAGKAPSVKRARSDASRRRPSRAAKPAGAPVSSTSVRQRMIAYAVDHPDATPAQIAEAINAKPKSVSTMFYEARRRGLLTRPEPAGELVSANGATANGDPQAGE